MKKDKPGKAIIEACEGDFKGDPVEVMFNPSEYNLVYTADVSGTESTGRGKKKGETDPFFDKVKVEDFTVKLIFDAYENHKNIESGDDVRNITKKITRLMKPTSKGTAKKKPPICTFSWGKFIYKGIITKIDQRFILFLPDGTPVRVEMTVTFKAIHSQEQFEKNSGLDACRKAWTVKTGDRLDLIAALELKDATLWRKIAYENNIEDPLKFPTKNDIGKRILIPD
jgi:hypothetical protein